MEGLPIDPIDVLKPENLPPKIQSEIRYQELGAGETLFHQSDVTKAIYALESGRIRLDRYTSEGRVVTFQIVRPGEAFAITALFDLVQEFNAISEVTSRIIVYPKQVLMDALPTYPNLAQELMKQLARNLDMLRVRLELRDIRVARDRILHYLKTIAEFSGTTIEFERPLKLVALDLGLTPEVFYRTLAHLEQRGMISRNNRIITLHQLPAA